MDDFMQRADAELESSEREVGDVRAILAEAADRLLHDFTRGQALTALQFQDLSDQLLATALRRIAAVRAQLRAAGQPGGTAPEMPSPVRTVQRADLQPGSAELF